jgi:ORF6N domain
MARARSKNSAKAASSEALALEQVEPLIHEVRGEKVILDSDLARLYGVTTKRLNEQVKRNQERFPEDFLFQVTREEVGEAQRSRSQIATASHAGAPKRSQIATASKRNIRHRPYACTEHGAIMAANVLNSPLAFGVARSLNHPFVK